MTLLDTVEFSTTGKVGYVALLVALIVAGAYSAYGIHKEANKRHFNDKQR